MGDSNGGMYIPVEMRVVDFPAGGGVLQDGSTVADVCALVAGVLHDALEARGDVVLKAREQWEGPKRDEFDDTWSPLEASLIGLKDDLNALVGLIDGLTLDLGAINAQRAMLREEYLATEAQPILGPGAI